LTLQERGLSPFSQTDYLSDHRGVEAFLRSGYQGRLWTPSPGFILHRDRPQKPAHLTGDLVYVKMNSCLANIIVAGFQVLNEACDVAPQFSYAEHRQITVEHVHFPFLADFLARSVCFSGVLPAVLFIPADTGQAPDTL
jgi:hypothetical protein